MDEYLHNRLIKLIALKRPRVEFSVPYDCNIPQVLSPKKINDYWIDIDKFNLGKDKGLKKIINYFS